MDRQTRPTREQIAELRVNRQEHSPTSPLMAAEARARVLTLAREWLDQPDAEGEVGEEDPDAPLPF